MKILAPDKALGAEYNRGRKDEREKISNIINAADDMSQAMYRIIKYLMCEKLQELEELKK